MREADTVSLTIKQYVANGKALGFTKTDFLHAIAEVFGPAVSQQFYPNLVNDDIRIQWKDFYKEYFGLDVDFSKVVIPGHQSDFDRVIIIAKGLTINQVIEVCKKRFKVWIYTSDHDVSVSNNDRTPAKSSYAIRIRNRREADEELKNKSTNRLAEEDIKGTTLLERFVFEFKYFAETGKHLDIKNITLCSGSRDSDGDIPYVRWDGDRLRVLWCLPSYAGDHLRSRAVVS